MGRIIKKSIIENVPFWILMGASIIMGVIAFFMPPQAEIHPSVLRLISWFFAFDALYTVLVAIKKGIDARLSHGKTSLELNNPDQDTSKNNTNHEEE